MRQLPAVRVALQLVCLVGIVASVVGASSIASVTSLNGRVPSNVTNHTVVFFNATDATSHVELTIDSTVAQSEHWLYIDTYNSTDAASKDVPHGSGGMPLCSDRDGSTTEETYLVRVPIADALISGQNTLVLTPGMMNHALLGIDRKYALCATNLTSHEAAGDGNDADTLEKHVETMGHTGVYISIVGTPAASNLIEQPTLVLPHGLAAAPTNLTLIDFAVFNGAAASALPDMGLGGAPAGYIVRLSTDCRRSNSLLMAAERPNAAGNGLELNVSTTGLDTLPQGARFRLCVAGSDALNVTFQFVGDLLVNGAHTLSSVSSLSTTLIAGTTTSFSVVEASTPTDNARVSRLSFYLCDAATGTVAIADRASLAHRSAGFDVVAQDSSSLTVSASSYAYDIALCMTGPSSSPQSVRLNLAFNIVWFSQIGGVSAGSSPFNEVALNNWEGSANISYDVIWNGLLVDSTYFYVSAQANCTTDSATLSVDFVPSSTTLRVPSAWLTGSTMHLCVSTARDFAGVAVLPFVLRVLTVSSIRPYYDVAGMPTDAPVHFLSTDDSPTVVVTGEFQNQAVRVGVVNSGGTQCINTVAVGSTGNAIFSPTLLSSGGSNTFCVSSSGGTKLNIGTFHVAAIATFAGRAVSSVSSGIPAFVMSSTSGAVSNLTFTLTGAASGYETFLANGITIEVCNSASGSVLGITTQGAERTVAITAPVAAAGQQLLCWRLRSMPTASLSVAVVQLYVMPPVSSTLALSPADGFARLRQPYSVQLRFPPTAAVVAATRFAIGLVAGASCSSNNTAVAWRASADLSASNSSAGVELLTTASGTFAVCAGFGSIAYGEDIATLDLAHPIAVLRHHAVTFNGAVTVPNGTVTLPFLTFGEVPSATVGVTPQLSGSDTLSLSVVPEAYDCSYAESVHGAPLFSDAAVDSRSQGSSFAVNTALLQTGGTYRLCLRSNTGPWTYSDAKVRIVVVRSVDAVSTNGTNNGTAISNGTSAPQSVPNVPTGISALVGASRDYVVSGTDMDAPFGWRLSFYTGNVTSSSDCLASPAAAFSASTITSENVTFQLSFATPAAYAGMCLSAEAAEGVYQHSVLSSRALVLPVASFVTGGGSPVTTHLKAISGVGTRYNINFANGSSAALLAGLFFIAAPSCGVVDVMSASRLLFPLTVETSGNAYIEVPRSNVTSAEWPLCLVDEASALRRQSSSSSAAMSSFDTGLVVTYVSVSLNAVAPGEGANIGHFRGSALTLSLGGGAELANNEDFELFVFLDSVACGVSTRTGTLPSSGLSRSPMPVTSCGTQSATVVIPAATGYTTSHLNLCLLLVDREPAAGQAAPATVVIDSNTTLTISGADALAFVVPMPTKTSIDQSFSSAPALSITDLSSATVLSSLPFDVQVEATWYVVEPVQQRIDSPTYTAVGIAGAASIDFSTSNIAHPGVFGYKYVLEFVVKNRGDISAINSSVVVRSDCYTKTQWASVYTDTCVSCPNHGLCDGSTSFNVTGSYWRPTNHSTATFSCGTPYAGSTCESNTEMGECLPGHTGPRCSVCEADYGKAIDTCVQCNPGYDWLVVLLALVFFVVILMILVFTTMRCKKSDQLPIYLKVLITHMWTAAILGGTSLLLPPVVVEYFQVQKTVARPTPEFASFDCFFGTTFYDKFIILNVVPVAIAVCIALVLILRAINHACTKDADDTSNTKVGSNLDTRPKTAHIAADHDEESEQHQEETAEARELERKRSMAMQKAIRKQSSGHFFMIIMIVVLFYGYPSLVEWCINVLRCDDLSYDERQTDGAMRHVSYRVVYFDRNIDCDSAEATAYRTAGLILTFVWGFGIPLSSVIIFVRLRAGVGRVLASRMFTFVVAGYRSSVWWWETVLLMRKFAIIVIVSFVSDPRLQSLISFWVLAIHLVAHMIVCPYEYRTVDRMETVSLYVLCGTLNLGLLFDWVSIDETEALWLQIAGWALSVVVLVLNIGVIIWMVYLVIAEANNKFKRWIRDNRQWCEDAVPCCGNWLVRHGFSGLGDEADVNAPALTYHDLHGAANNRNARQNLAEMARHGTVANMMVIEDDSASDWSDSDSNSDESVIVDSASADFHMNGLNGSRFPQDERQQHAQQQQQLVSVRSLRQLGQDGEEAPEDMANFAAPARAHRPSTTELQAPVRSAMRRHHGSGDENASGIFVQVADNGDAAGAYRLGHTGDDQMSGAFSAGELRKAAKNGDVIDGVNNVAQSFEVGSSDDDAAENNGPGSPTCPNTAGPQDLAPGVVQTASMCVDPKQHDVKQCTNVIRTLRASMSALRERAETLGTENAELKASIEHLERNIATLEKRAGVAQEYSAKMEAQVNEQVRTITTIQEAVSKLEAENVQLRRVRDHAAALESEKQVIEGEREMLRSQLRERPKTSDHLAAAIDGWKEQSAHSTSQRDAQLKILQIEAGLRAERIDELERESRAEQQRLVEEHLERKRVARAAKMGRPSTDGAAGASAIPTPRLQSAPMRGQSAGMLMQSVSTAGGGPLSPGSTGSRKISFASRARAVGRVARAFSPSNLSTSVQDEQQLERMQTEGVLPDTDAAGRPVVVIHRKKAEKLKPSVRRGLPLK